MSKQLIIRSLACISLFCCGQKSSHAQSEGYESSAFDRELAWIAARNSPILNMLTGAEEVTLQNKQTWLLGVGKATLTVAAKRSETKKQELLRVAQSRAAANILKLTNTQLTSKSQSSERFQVSGQGEGDKVSFNHHFSEKICVHASGNVSRLSDLGFWESKGSVFVAVGTRIR
jgi:hypothetical protein